MFAARGTTGEGGDAPDHQEEPLGLSWAPPRLRPLFLLKGFPWERIHDNVKNSWCAGDPHVPVPAVKRPSLFAQRPLLSVSGSAKSL